MSEFSIDEKANAYDLALNKAKTLLSKCKRVSDKASIIYRAEDIENIFPELQKPSDEKIKETLIELVKCNERCGYTLLNNVSTSSMLAWLEKQNHDGKKWIYEDVYIKDANWLKSIKERVQSKQNEQKSVDKVGDWSEDDELILKDTIEFIETGWSNRDKSHLVSWLKSIRKKLNNYVLN